MTPIVVTREGHGPEVLLVHGGASPATTWSGLEEMGGRWTLARVHRHGFPPSPEPPAGRVNFELDAEDLVELLDARPHVVAHSYGCLGALLAAERRPEGIRSLTIIEPPLFFVAGDDPAVHRLERLGNAALIDGLDADPAELREFLRLAGSPVLDDGPLPDAVANAVRRAHGTRPPGEARPDLDALRAAGLATLIASGDHEPAIERICDALAARLGAERFVAPGAGHFVAAAPGFRAGLESFLHRVTISRPTG